MYLKRPLPRNRNYEQVKNHYLVEKSIATKLKTASREERKRIYATMYEELFSKVPDHPRLSRRQSAELTTKANTVKLSVVRKFLDDSYTFMEFAPGDCRFTFEVAKLVQFAYGADISDQRNPKDDAPDNFKLIVYDGYNLDKVENNSIDLVFSDQLIEHFHPDDTRLHFELVYRILKAGGKYVFRTPHPITGPHDVSKYFCDEPECFHLKEWTFSEIKELILSLKYSDFKTHWVKRGINLRLPFFYFSLCEQALKRFNRERPLARLATKCFIPSLCGVAVK